MCVVSACRLRSTLLWTVSRTSIYSPFQSLPLYSGDVECSATVVVVANGEVQTVGHLHQQHSHSITINILTPMQLNSNNIYLTLNRKQWQWTTTMADATNLIVPKQREKSYNHSSTTRITTAHSSTSRKSLHGVAARDTTSTRIQIVRD